ncbi:hypothetical protein [Myxococcus sp. CA039A]|uniref:hypothetical protein n=1 Tax=Myxococcus sp. CA039A TaxID=2741737 RepID=UPI00157A79E9|nr:hypothetical protein [Myxococcus sp. CA039A]NTX51850.1 hypothetical protein [Myxococcus sp. CA039A]
MDMEKRRALSERLGWAEMGLQLARAMMDGSPESRTLLASAKREYGDAEAAVLAELGARAALALVEERHAVGEVAPQDAYELEGFLARGQTATSHRVHEAQDGRGPHGPRGPLPARAERCPREEEAAAAVCR